MCIPLKRLPRCPSQLTGPFDPEACLFFPNKLPLFPFLLLCLPGAVFVLEYKSIDSHAQSLRPVVMQLCLLFLIILLFLDADQRPSPFSVTGWSQVLFLRSPSPLLSSLLSPSTAKGMTFSFSSASS